MDIQWYPGHMAKARRAMQEDLKLVDLVMELVDARAPLASRNPDIDGLAKGKERLILLNKSDLADDRFHDAWIRYFTGQGFLAAKINAKNGAGVKQINAAAKEACKSKLERNRKRGILHRPIRVMVAGIPNVGKSTFINTLVGKASAKTGNKPGITRANQWIRLDQDLELLDTPGILWPKFGDQRIGIALALIGSIRDEILNQEELALELIRFLSKDYPEALEKRYRIRGIESDLGTETLGVGGPALQVLEEIARGRGCLMKGGLPDCSRASAILMDDFRSGKLGRITLEFPEKVCSGAL